MDSEPVRAEERKNPASAVASARNTDRCASMIPDALRSDINRKFPTYRIPRVSDPSCEEVRRNLRSGGSGCLSVTEGDYDGDGRGDVAVILPSTTKPKGILLVVGRRVTAGAWEVEGLVSWERSIGSLSARTLRPESYQATPIIEGEELEAGEVRSVVSRVDGIEIGLLESSSVGYFYDGRSWQYVQLPD